MTNQYSLKICGKYFGLKLEFDLIEYELKLKNATRERIINPIVIKDNNKILVKNNSIIKVINKDNDFLIYLKSKGLGEYTYIEINFDSINIYTLNSIITYSYSLINILEKESVKSLIKANRIDKKRIISTLLHEPLIPSNQIELLLNNLLIEEVFKGIDKKFKSKIITNKIIISGEIVWSNWLSDIGAITICKNLLENNDYYINYDNNGLWNSMFEKRKQFDFLYKISNEIFNTDFIFINSIQDLKDRKFTIEGSDSTLISSNKKYANILISKGTEKQKSIFIINNEKINSILKCSSEDLKLNLLDKSKIYIKVGEISKVSYSIDNIAKAKFGNDINLSLKNNQTVKLNDFIGYKKIPHISSQSVNTKRFIQVSVDKQLVQQGDVIGYESDILGKKAIKAISSGKIIYQLLKYGLILIEDKDLEQEILSPWSGKCISHSNIDGYNILIDSLLIPVKYQIGNNISILFRKNIKLDFNQILICKTISVDSIPVKKIIDNNIKLIIVEQFDEFLFNEYIKKYPFITNFVSFAIISDEIEKIDLRIDSLLNNKNLLKMLILEDGILKIYCNKFTKEFDNLKSQFNTVSQEVVRRISYERENIYGIIIKSQNSTEKVVKYDTEDVVVSNSNLINLKYKL